MKISMHDASRLENIRSIWKHYHTKFHIIPPSILAVLCLQFDFESLCTYASRWGKIRSTSNYYHTKFQIIPSSRLEVLWKFRSLNQTDRQTGTSSYRTFGSSPRVKKINSQEGSLGGKWVSWNPTVWVTFGVKWIVTVHNTVNNKTKCNVQQTFGFFVRTIFVRKRASDFRKVKNISRTIEPKVFGKFKDNNFF